MKVKKDDSVNKNTVLFDIVDDSYYILKANFHYNANNPIQVGDSVNMMVNDAFSYMQGTVSKVSDFKQHYEFGGEIQEVEIQVKNPGYTLEGIVVSQIIVSTQSNAKIMALANSAFETLDSVNFKCPSSGTISQLNINNGDYISTDSLVMVLENEDLYENLSDAKTSLPSV